MFGILLDIDDISVVEFGGASRFFLGLRREAGGDDFDFSFEALGEEITDDGAEGWDEEKKANRVGEEAGGQEDCSGEEDHESVEGLLVGHASFPGGLLEFRHSDAALGFGESGPDDRGDDNDVDGIQESQLGS